MAPAVMSGLAAQSELALHMAATVPTAPTLVKASPLCIGALLQGGDNLSSLAAAAKDRKTRLRNAIQGDLEGVPWLERSELGTIARQQVRRWASGLISGERCLLELGLCSMAAQLVPDQPRRHETGDEVVREHVVSLWIVGVAGLWAQEKSLQGLSADLQAWTPSQFLIEAWTVVEFECGASADQLHPDEINLALHRLTMRARQDQDPSAFVRVQLWRELLYVETGADIGASCTASDRANLDFPRCTDSSILHWLRMKDADLRAEVQGMSVEQLHADVALLETFAAQMLQLDLWLREAFDGWQRSDAYRVLGIPRSALLSEVRRAFHKRALRLHPDKGGVTEEFQKLQQAYEEILALRGAKRHCSGDDDEDQEEHQSSSPPETPRQKAQQKHDKKVEKNSNSEKNFKGEKDTRESPLGEQQGSKVNEGVAPNMGGSANVDRSEVDPEDAEDPIDCSDECLLTLSEAAQSAAEEAGEYATATLRHCQVGCEAVVADPPQWHKAKANMHAALKRVAKVTLAARRAGVQSGRVAGLVETKCEVSEAAAEELEVAGKAAAEASVAVHAGVEQCNARADAASTLLQEMEASGFPPAGLAGKFSDALDQLAAVVKVSAIAAIQAAEAASKVVNIALRCGSLQHEDGNGASANDEMQKEHPEEQSASSESETQVTHDGSDAKVEKTNQEEQPSENAQKNRSTLEERRAQTRAQTAFLSVCQLLRRANRELLELQHQARRLAVQDSTVLPPVPALYRQQTFALLAEYLDEAAVRFHDILQATSRTNGSRFPEVCGACVLEAVDQCFGFLLTTSAELAIPADARAQTLRAAATLDVDALKALMGQACKRLQGSLTVALLDSNGGSCSGIGTCAVAATPEAVAALLAVPMQQLSGALDSLILGLRTGT